MSTHHPYLMRNIIKIIRITDNSSEERIFNEVKEEYEIAFRNIGFKMELDYIAKPREKNRNRKVIWLNQA